MKLFQINTCLGVGSTGRITEDISTLMTNFGWDCYIAHGARYVGASKMKSVQVGSIWEEYMHFAKSFLFDEHGLGTIVGTKKLICKIENVKPDIIHLHCIHGYFLNYRLLFEYLNAKNIPVVWTFHDCWAFTGHCAYLGDCNKWETEEGCRNCSLTKTYPQSIIDKSRRNYNLKRDLFVANNNLHIVAVSEWLTSLIKKSFFKEKDIKTIVNGVNTDVFRFRPNRIKQRLKIEDKKMLLGVASTWEERKGLIDYYKLADILPNKYQIVLVGLTPKQKDSLPNNIIGITRTDNCDELVEYYSAADIVMNLSCAETFGLTTVEGFACGTPSIVYDVTASPELISEETGLVVPVGDVNAVCEAVEMLSAKDKSMYYEVCRNRAVMKYDKNKRYIEYLNLYNKLLNK